LIIHAHTREWWVHKNGGDRNTIRHLAARVVEQVLGNDLEVVVRGVSERSAAIDFSQGPDVGHGCAELVVDFDESRRVDFALTMGFDMSAWDVPYSTSMRRGGKDG
jgi:hypothetical protein